MITPSDSFFEALIYLVLLPPFIWAICLFGLEFVVLRGKKTLSAPALRWLGYGSVLVSVISLGAAFALLLRFNVASGYVIDFASRLDSIHLYVDALGLYFILIINIVAFAASWNAISYLEWRQGAGGYKGPVFFHGLMNLFHFTMLLVPAVDNLIGLWIAIESTTLVSALLVAYPNHRRAWEAAWKYLIITSSGIILAFMGTIFLAHGANLAGVKSMDWSVLMKNAIPLSRSSNAQSFVVLAFLFVLAGYGVKAGLAPMHTWLPDAHGEAAPPVSALFSGVLLKSAFYAILRFFTLTNGVLAVSEGKGGGASMHFTYYILGGTGIFSLLMAVPFIINRKNHFKRILAYHSLEHMGIIVFGVGVGGGTVAMFGALLHTLNHAITKALMFLAHGNVIRTYSEAFGPNDPDAMQETQNITGLLQSMPLTGILLIIGGLALVGTPPFNIFLSIWMILWGSMEQVEALLTGGASASAHLILLIVAILLFLLSTMFIYFGMVQHLARLVLGSAPQNRRLKESFFDLFPLLLLITLVIVMGVWLFPPLAELIQQSVDIVTSVPSS